MTHELKEQLILLLEQTLKENLPNDLKMPPIILENPPDKKFGDFSCNCAMRLASHLKKNPLELANQWVDKLIQNLPQSPLAQRIQKIEAMRPGFINFYVADSAVGEVLTKILKEGALFGRSSFGAGKKVQIEFVSANPTGPLSVAHARQAAVGDALGNILSAIGFKVTKEFYVNDEGNQINILGRSIQWRAKEILGESIVFPEDGYQGDYIKDMAQIFLKQQQIASLDALRSIPEKDFRDFGVHYLLKVIQQELLDFHVVFDVWSSQAQIATESSIKSVLQLLKNKGFLYENEGALWFKSTEFGDDKDRVVQKSDGQFTYLTPDIVYHQHKFNRGFDLVFNIWGPDHHGYIPRLKAAVQALGFNSKNLEVLIVQLATIFRDGQALSMSTRRGQYISLQEVMDDVGVDAARFFFLMRHIKAHLEFDLELAKKTTAENPVFYVQYAHARICSILKSAQEAKRFHQESDFKLLKEPQEIDLMKLLGYFPEVLLVCCHQRDPFALVDYVQQVAASFHRFYDLHRVMDENRKDLSLERLGLVAATGHVLFNGLSLLGVSAPKQM